MTLSRSAIIESFDRLSGHQRVRRIHPWDILEAAVLFGDPLAEQLQRDYLAQFKAWDSFSMILQCETLLPSDAEVERFGAWAFGRLGLEL
ncbi:MAG: hypothetical protein ACLP5H_03860 [Desulfomonilaceae bacterium]